MRIGISEVLLIIVITIALVKPDKLKEYSKLLGKTLRFVMEERERIVKPIEDAVKPVKDLQDEINNTIVEMKNGGEK